MFSDSPFKPEAVDWMEESYRRRREEVSKIQPKIQWILHQTDEEFKSQTMGVLNLNKEEMIKWDFFPIIPVWCPWIEVHKDVEQYYRMERCRFLMWKYNLSNLGLPWMFLYHHMKETFVICQRIPKTEGKIRYHHLRSLYKLGVHNYRSENMVMTFNRRLYLLHLEECEDIYNTLNYLLMIPNLSPECKKYLEEKREKHRKFSFRIPLFF